MIETNDHWELVLLYTFSFFLSKSTSPSVLSLKKTLLYLEFFAFNALNNLSLILFKKGGEMKLEREGNDRSSFI